jgi:hypothetical protein
MHLLTPAQVAVATRLAVGFRHYPVANLKIPRTRPRRNDWARKLVTEKHGRPARELVVADVDIGAANAARLYLHDYLSWAGHRLRNLPKLNQSDSSSNLHERLHELPPIL